MPQSKLEPKLVTVLREGYSGTLFFKDLTAGTIVGIAILAGLTIVCYLAIIPTLMRKKDTAYLVIAVVEVLVLTLAASGILKGGGH